MNILAVSDESHLYHANVKQRYPNIDLILGCGDTSYSYLNFLTSALDKPMLYVWGNHDTPPPNSSGLENAFSVGVPANQYHQPEVLKEVKGGRNIHGRCVREKGLIIAGFEGSVRFPPYMPCMYEQWQMRLIVRSLYLRFLWNEVRYGRAADIIITHAPPWEIHAKDDLPHQGFKAFLPLLRRFRPRYLLHGHIHRHNHHVPQITQYHDTTIINVYPAYVLNIERVTTPSLPSNLGVA